MEDTPTDPNEAQVIIGTATQHINELLVALAAQTERADRAIKQLEECTYSHQQTNARFEEACERADRLQAEVEELKRRCSQEYLETLRLNRENDTLNDLRSGITRLTAELDAVRKERDEANRKRDQFSQEVANNALASMGEFEKGALRTLRRPSQMRRVGEADSGRAS